MTLRNGDRVADTTTTTGTGNITLAGSPPTSYVGFADIPGIALNDEVWIAIVHTTLHEFEVCLARWLGSNTLERVSVYSSSNGGAPVNFSAGTKNVFCTLPQSKVLQVAGSAGQVQYNDGAALAATPIWREDANTLAQRNGANGQSFFSYNTYTDSTNYERGALAWSGNVMTVGAQAAGTGALRDMKLSAAKINLDASHAYGGAFIQTGNAADGSNTIPAGVPYAGSAPSGSFRVATNKTTDYTDGWHSAYQCYAKLNVTTGAGSRDFYGADLNAEIAATDTKTRGAYGVYGGVVGRSNTNTMLYGLQFSSRLASGAAPTNAVVCGSYILAQTDGPGVNTDFVGIAAEMYNSNVSGTFSKFHGVRVLFWDDDTPTGRNYACESLQLYNREAYFVVGSDYYQTRYYYDIDGYGNYSIHNAWSSAGANRESAVFKWATNVLEIGTEAAGTGVLRNVKIKGDGVIVSDAGQKLGFFGATPIAKPAEITDELATITHTAPGTPDYAIQDLTNAGGFGFATKDEGNTVLAVIANLQARVNELETVLVNLGLLTDAD